MNVEEFIALEVQHQGFYGSEARVRVDWMKRAWEWARSPFRDGNGRTGKILLAWLERKFDDPEMPPDLFGGGVP